MPKTGNCNYLVFRKNRKSEVFFCENFRFYLCLLSVLFCFSGVSVGDSCMLSLLLVVVGDSCLSGVGCRLSVSVVAHLSVLSSEIHSP